MSAESDCVAKLQNENEKLKILNKNLQFDLGKLKLKYDRLLHDQTDTCVKLSDPNFEKSNLCKNEISALILLGYQITYDLTTYIDCMKHEIPMLSEQIDIITDNVKKCKKSEENSYDMKLLKDETFSKNDNDYENILHDCIRIRNIMIRDYYNLGTVDKILEEIRHISEVDDFLNRCKVDEMLTRVKPSFQMPSSLSRLFKTEKLMIYVELLSKSLIEIYNEQQLLKDAQCDFNDTVLTSILNHCNFDINEEKVIDNNTASVVNQLKNVILVMYENLQKIKREYKVCRKEEDGYNICLADFNTFVDKVQLIRTEFDKIKTISSVCTNSCISSSCFILNSIECLLNDIESTCNNRKVNALVDIFFIYDPGKYKRLKEYLNQLTTSTTRLEECVNYANSNEPFSDDEKLGHINTIYSDMKKVIGYCDKEIDQFIMENEELCDTCLQLSNVCEQYDLSQECDVIKVYEILKFSRLFQITDVTLKRALKQETVDNEQDVVRLLGEIVIDKINSCRCNEDKIDRTVRGLTRKSESIGICNALGNNDLDISDEASGVMISGKKDLNELLCVGENVKLLMTLITELKSFFAALSSVLRKLIYEIPILVREVNSEVQVAMKNVIESAVASLESRNEDLLKDMLEMNAELKKRGEIISQLNENNEELQKHNSRLSQQYEELRMNYEENKTKLKQEIQQKDELLERNISEVDIVKRNYELQIDKLSSDIEKLEMNVNDLQRKLNEKEVIINDLEQEISRRDIQDGDTSSMGTLSRTDENTRLRDIEDSFEDRYNKLRILAVKMKKRISELNQQLEMERNNFSNEKNELQNKLSQLMLKVKLSQTLQSECDRLNDMLELKEVELTKLKKANVENVENISKLETKVYQLSQQLEESNMTQELMSEDKNSLEEKITSFISQLDMLEEEKIMKDSINREKDDEILILKQKINEGEENLKKLRNEFEQAKLEIRKQGTLSLEMKDYEKTITELMNQLTMEKNRCDELNEKVNESFAINSSLTRRIKELEIEIATSSENNKQANEEILHLNKKFVDYERSLSERESSLQEITQLYQSVDSKKNELEDELSELQSHQRNQKENFENIQLSLTKQVNSLQMELSVLKDQAKKKECELERLSKDFENYKIRAQGILQKHKTESAIKSNENLMRHQIENLEKTIDELKTELIKNKNEFENFKTDANTIQLEKEKLFKRNKELTNLITDKSTQLESIIAEFQTYKSDIGIRINSYQDEIERLNIFKNEVYNLRKKYEDAESEIDSLRKKIENTPDLIHSYSSENNKDLSSRGLNHDLQSQNRILHRKISDVPSLPDSNIFSNEKPILVPLESLLSNSADEEIVPKLKQQLLVYEDQIRNLEYMLRESEDGLTRNEHQVSVLKDEIRRLQRTIDREPHIKNAEYLKNVILKFLTLQHGDEKTCLVPVLETILKLSPEETKQLMSMAKDGTSESWTSWSNLLSWN